MPGTRCLLRENITYSTARTREVNILHQLGYYDQQNQFFTRISYKHTWIKTIVAHHLGLRSSDACHVADMKDWLHGSFNVCVPVTIQNWGGKQQPGTRVLLRLPLPYRVGECYRPGNCDEKVRCEAGAYVWLQENCPDVPIPRLYGFAVSTDETFTQLENLPFLTRCFQHLRRQILSWLGRPIPSRYVRHQAGEELSIDKGVGTGYMLIEYIEESRGKMLSTTWFERHSDTKLRDNFFRDLSRILLSVARVPLPRLGSFIVDSNGFLQLTNRPLSLEVQELENQEIPTDIPRDYTYSTVDSYIMDVLAFHDNRLRYQPNAINDTGDYIYQSSALTAMRAIFPLYLQRKFRRGPFIFTLTDLHQSNIFVDGDWHIISLVDLEWACSQPIEMVQPPYWLTNKPVDKIDSEEYNNIRTEFMAILAEEERSNNTECGEDGDVRTSLKLSSVMEQAWETGTFWYSLALSSPTGLFAIFENHLQPKLIEKSPDHGAFHQIMPWYWAQNIVSILMQKLSDRKDYDERLQQMFEDVSLKD